jgi:hypothetical protein
MNKVHRAAWTGLLIPLVIGLIVWAASFPAHAAAATAAPGIDIVVVVDDSGSMATCWPWWGPPRSEPCPESQNPPSDPRNLRYDAVRLLVQLANDEDQLSVVRFASTAEDVTGQLRPVGSPAGRNGLIDAIRPPTDYAANGGYTRLDLALARAEQILAADAKTESRPRYVLLLTDGVPTQPGDVPSQAEPVQHAMSALHELGAQVLPVVLCNDKAGCPDDSFIRGNIGRAPEQAKTPADLLQVFSSLLAQMEPGLHVLAQGNGTELTFNIRPEHGAQRLVIVAGKDDLQALTRDGSPVPVSSAYQGDNILVNAVDAAGLAAGKWTVQTQGSGAFVVVQTQTYPDLIFPPSSIPGSSAAPIYVPAGKPVALLAKIVGPGSTEPLHLDDGTVLQPYGGPGGPLWTVLPGATNGFTLQVGDDKAPLQIQRSFSLQARADLPTVLPVSPTAASPCAAGAACPLRVAFGPGAEVAELQGMVYVSDESAGGKLVYSGPMICTGRECADEARGFQRLDGHHYTVRFFVQARSAGVLFGDWAETTLAVAPAVHLQGLAGTLDLETQPASGWPVTVTSGTIEDLGQLHANIALTRTEDNAPVPDARVHFSAGLRATGQQTATLRVVLPDALRPGNYRGQITFAVDRPPAGNQVLLPAPIPVSLALARPAVEVQSSTVDFGSVLFSTSPNFRIDRSASIIVAYNETPFQIVPTLSQSNCQGLSVVAGEPAPQGDHSQVALTLRSSGPISPQTCSGTITLNGPSEDYEIQSNRTITWRLVVPTAEWQLVGIERAGSTVSDLAFGNIGRPGDRGSAVLLIRYTGQPPFSLDLLDLQGQADRGSATISKSDLELATGNITARPGEAGLYSVPVDLVVGRSLPQRSQGAAWFYGTDYSGKVHVDIAGLPNSSSLEVSFRLHNPGWTQRHIAPFYTLMWPGLLTYPVSILLPLVLFAFIWLRKKDADVERYLQGANGAPFPVDVADGEGAPAPTPTGAPAAPRRDATAAGRTSVQSSPGRAASKQVPRRPTRPSERPVGHAGTTPGLTPAPRPPAAESRRPERPASPPSRPPRSRGTNKAQ